MAFEKNINEVKILFLVLIGIPLIASTNIDCGGKSFHCLNSTHFMICVDFGGGLSYTVDDFMIPCPSPTVCLTTNRFECELPPRTIVVPTTEKETTTEEVIIDTIPWNTGPEQHLELSTVATQETTTDTAVIPLQTVATTNKDDMIINTTESSIVTTTDGWEIITVPEMTANITTESTLVAVNDSLELTTMLEMTTTATESNVESFSDTLELKLVPEIPPKAIKSTVDDTTDTLELTKEPEITANATEDTVLLSTETLELKTTLEMTANITESSIVAATDRLDFKTVPEIITTATENTYEVTTDTLELTSAPKITANETENLVLATTNIVNLTTVPNNTTDTTESSVVATTGMSELKTIVPTTDVLELTTLLDHSDKDIGVENVIVSTTDLYTDTLAENSLYENGLENKEVFITIEPPLNETFKINMGYEENVNVTNLVNNTDVTTNSTAQEDMLATSLDVLNQDVRGQDKIVSSLSERSVPTTDDTINDNLNGTTYNFKNYGTSITQNNTVASKDIESNSTAVNIEPIDLISENLTTPVVDTVVSVTDGEKLNGTEIVTENIMINVTDSNVEATTKNLLDPISTENIIVSEITNGSEIGKFDNTPMMDNTTKNKELIISINNTIIHTTEVPLASKIDKNITYEDTSIIINSTNDVEEITTAHYTTISNNNVTQNSESYTEPSTTYELMINKTTIDIEVTPNTVNKIQNVETSTVFNTPSVGITTTITANETDFRNKEENTTFSTSDNKQTINNNSFSNDSGTDENIITESIINITNVWKGTEIRLITSNNNSLDENTTIINNVIIVPTTTLDVSSTSIVDNSPVTLPNVRTTLESQSSNFVTENQGLDITTDFETTTVNIDITEVRGDFLAVTESNGLLEMTTTSRMTSPVLNNQSIVHLDSSRTSVANSSPTPNADIEIMSKKVTNYGHSTVPTVFTDNKTATNFDLVNNLEEQNTNTNKDQISSDSITNSGRVQIEEKTHINNSEDNENIFISSTSPSTVAFTTNDLLSSVNVEIPNVKVVETTTTATAQATKLIDIFEIDTEIILEHNSSTEKQEQVTASTLVTVTEDPSTAFVQSFNAHAQTGGEVTTAKSSQENEILDSLNLLGSILETSTLPNTPPKLLETVSHTEESNNMQRGVEQTTLVFNTERSYDLNTLQNIVTNNIFSITEKNIFTASSVNTSPMAGQISLLPQNTINKPHTNVTLPQSNETYITENSLKQSESVSNKIQSIAMNTKQNSMEQIISIPDQIQLNTTNVTQIGRTDEFPSFSDTNQMNTTKTTNMLQTNGETVKIFSVPVTKELNTSNTPNGVIEKIASVFETEQLNTTNTLQNNNIVDQNSRGGEINFVYLNNGSKVKQTGEFGYIKTFSDSEPITTTKAIENIGVEQTIQVQNNVMDITHNNGVIETVSETGLEEDAGSNGQTEFFVTAEPTLPSAMQSSGAKINVSLEMNVIQNSESKKQISSNINNKIGSQVRIFTNNNTEDLTATYKVAGQGQTGYGIQNGETLQSDMQTNPRESNINYIKKIIAHANVSKTSNLTQYSELEQSDLLYTQDDKNNALHITNNTSRMSPEDYVSTSSIDIVETNSVGENLSSVPSVLQEPSLLYEQTSSFTSEGYSNGNIITTTLPYNVLVVTGLSDNNVKPKEMDTANLFETEAENFKYLSNDVSEISNTLPNLSEHALQHSVPMVTLFESAYTTTSKQLEGDRNDIKIPNFISLSKVNSKAEESISKILNLDLGNHVPTATSSMMAVNENIAQFHNSQTSETLQSIEGLSTTPENTIEVKQTGDFGYIKTFSDSEPITTTKAIENIGVEQTIQVQNNVMDITHNNGVNETVSETGLEEDAGSNGQTEFFVTAEPTLPSAMQSSGAKINVSLEINVIQNSESKKQISSIINNKIGSQVRIFTNNNTEDLTATYKVAGQGQTGYRIQNGETLQSDMQTNPRESNINYIKKIIAHANVSETSNLTQYSELEQSDLLYTQDDKNNALHITNNTSRMSPEDYVSTSFIDIVETNSVGENLSSVPSVLQEPSLLYEQTSSFTSEGYSNGNIITTTLPYNVLVVTGLSDNNVKPKEMDTANLFETEAENFKYLSNDVSEISNTLPNLSEHALQHSVPMVTLFESAYTTTSKQLEGDRNDIKIPNLISLSKVNSKAEESISKILNLDLGNHVPTATSSMMAVNENIAQFHNSQTSETLQSIEGLSTTPENTIEDIQINVDANTESVIETLLNDNKLHNEITASTTSTTLTILSDIGQQNLQFNVAVAKEDINSKDEKLSTNNFHKVSTVTTSSYVEVTKNTNTSLVAKLTTKTNSTEAPENSTQFNLETTAITTDKRSTVTLSTKSAANDQEKNISKTQFNCQNRPTGRYADNNDCSKFYICSGTAQTIVGTCPLNTVFSEIRKQCTKNRSHCIRNNEFKCSSLGRFADYLKPNVYYICARKDQTFLRYKLQCQNGYLLNRLTVTCYKNSLPTSASQSISSDTTEKIIEDAVNNSDKNIKNKEFECEDEGKFSDPYNCRGYYICKLKNKSEETYRRKHKKCDQDEVFHKEKKKCVDASSYECRYCDLLSSNVYYIRVIQGHHYLIYKLQCQNGYNLNMASVRCDKNLESSIHTRSTDSVNTFLKSPPETGKSITKEHKQKRFECQEDGIFADPNDNRRYYICKENNSYERSDSESGPKFRRKHKKCGRHELFSEEKHECFST